MKKCKYNLGHAEFYAVYAFFVTCGVDGDMTLDEYRKEFEGARPEILEDIRPGLESIGMLGESMFEIMENMKTHVRSCEECKAEYKNFLGSQMREELQIADFFEFFGIKTLREDIEDTDFLKLYSQ